MPPPRAVPLSPLAAPDAAPPLSASLLAGAMRRACAEAALWRGATAPNPPVGAVALGAGGEILGLAAHQRAGGAHAEADLLATLREQGRLGALHTLVVTLEPCNHHGRTPPCCDAILGAGVRRVVIGVRDPNRKVQGGGAERLRAAGVEVVEGVEAEACHRLIHAFAFAARYARPWLTVKRAVDEKGSMIPPPGSKTFTGPDSLVLAHSLRRRADAILTGSGTVLADDPAFTVRHVPDHVGRKRFLVILDRRRRVPESWVGQAEKRGFIVKVRDDPRAALEELHAQGVREVLAEAGPTLAGALLEEGLWTQDVLIRKGEPDRVTARLNPAFAFPFALRDETDARLDPG